MTRKTYWKNTSSIHKSKFSNRTSFEPQASEVKTVIRKYWEVAGQDGKPAFHARPLHPEFIMPVTLKEVEETLAGLPTKFTAGLKAVFLLGGNRKQRIVQSRFAYGQYCNGMVFLHPLPKNKVKFVCRKPFRPHIVQEYRRAGATIRICKGKMYLTFTADDLKTFYLRDVLVHEVGHHVDRQNFDRTHGRRVEAFAEWFATEYGFRRTQPESADIEC